MVSRALRLTPVLALLAACSTSDQVVGRYQQASCQTGNDIRPCNDVIPTAEASVTSVKTTEITTARGTSLPDRALAAYVRELANPRMSVDAKALRANLAAKISSAPASSETPDDQTVFHRTLIVTVSKSGDFNPADRLEATDVAITPIGARFQSWDTAATIYTTVNAGTVQLTQTRSTGQSLSLATPTGTPVTASVGLRADQRSSRVETLPATYQVESLTVSVEGLGKTLRIKRQGGTGIDLTGNTIVTVDLALVVDPNVQPTFSADGGYKTKAGAWLRASKVKLVSETVLTSPKPDGLVADVMLKYTVRHILSGDGTLEDRDDRVLEKTMQSHDKSSLISAREVGGDAYRLVQNSGRLRGYTLEVSSAGSATPVTLCFPSYAEASAFLVYERAANSRQPGILSGFHLGFSPLGGFSLLSSSDLPGLRPQSGC